MIERFALLRGSAFRVHCRIESLERRQLFSGTIDIPGVAEGTLENPYVNALLRRSPGGDPIAGEDFFGDPTVNITAYLDTGASGVLLSKETADQFGVQRETVGAGPDLVHFEDVGVGGATEFEVSEPLYTSIAPYSAETDIDNPDTYNTVYNQNFGPLRTQIAEDEADFFPLDVFGMPAMAGKVMVMDNRGVKDESDFGILWSYLYNPGTPFDAAHSDSNPGIPATNLHVDLSYASLDRFTDVVPAGSPGPDLRHNPFIGPNPVAQLDSNPPADHTPGVTMAFGGKSFTGSWLLDTGAQVSMVRRGDPNLGDTPGGAYSLGVRYVNGTYGTDNARLETTTGGAIAHQFQIQITGVGGPLTVAGFYTDSVSVQTEEGTTLRYVSDPVLVANITVADPITDQELTLDGVFGMNHMSDTEIPFDWLTFDEPQGKLGLQMPGVAYDVIAPTAAVTSAPNISAAGASSYTFNVRYSDDVAVRTSTLSNGDIRVTSPGGFSQLATLVSVDNDASGTPRTGTYRITPPGGMWDGADNGTYTLTMVASEVSDPGSNFVAAGSLSTFTVSAGAVGPSSIAARQVFYNNSKFDGFLVAPNANDDLAIATDKIALRPGNTATFANYSSYTKGINGVMVDIAALAGRTPSTSDFDVRVGVDTTSNPSTWATVAGPSVTIRPGAGVNGSDRVTLIWPDGTITNKWLRVAVKANANTGLSAQDVFYFGNAIGETGNSAANAIVDSGDYYKTRDFLRPLSNPAPVTWIADFNRDGVTDLTDIMLVRASANTAATALKLISVPSPLTAPVTKSGTTTTTTAATPFRRPAVGARRGWTTKS